MFHGSIFQQSLTVGTAQESWLFWPRPLPEKALWSGNVTVLASQLLPSNPHYSIKSPPLEYFVCSQLFLSKKLLSALS